MADSPFKPPSKAEETRKKVAIPLLVIPGAITWYVTFGIQGAKGFNWFTYRKLKTYFIYLMFNQNTIKTLWL
jgi:hypothetical protein